MENPDLRVRVSTPEGHFTVTRVVAERGGHTVLKQDALDQFGHPLPAKLRVDMEDTPKAAKRKAARKATTKPRVDTAAATPTEPETASGDNSKE